MIRIGADKPGDILISTICQRESDPTPEEKLLRANLRGKV
jgi:hypothetical protein